MFWTSIRTTRGAIASPTGVGRIESRWGERVAWHSTTVSPGSLFLSFHYPETHTNRLTSPHVDPQSKCPEYKITAVRVRATA
jgi:predicted molibdopterin-dependent oxidoreductase YjgC